MNSKILNYITPKRVFLFLLPIYILLFLISLGIFDEGSQQFTLLAKSFLHGHTYFGSSIGGLGQDPVFYHGKIYWSEEPFPAIILMPFVAFFDLFHVFFYAGYIKWLFMIGIIYFVYKLARILKYSAQDSLMMMFAFTLGSVFLGVGSVSSSWLYAQVVTTFFLFWSLYEFYTKKRWWLIGIAMACVTLTRPTATPLVIFFILEIWFSKDIKKIKWKNLIKVCLPVLISIFLILGYNYVRFHNPFNSGSSYELLANGSSEARAGGVFNPGHILSNIYSAFLRGPVPVLKYSDSWVLKYPFIENNNLGMSMFLTSPYLIYLFIKKRSSFSSRDKHLIIAILASALLVFSYFGDGTEQFGYRYTLDFLPPLFLLFMILYRKYNRSITSGMQFLMLGSILFNFYIVLSYIF